ncbi:MAG: nitroreductase family protein [Mycobacteriales bacterium]
MTVFATAEQVRHVVQAAGLAPSVHNTQPWRFLCHPDRLDLMAEPSRRLAVLDPDSRQLHLSCGAALMHARVAARALGLDVAVTVLPDAGQPEHLARLTLTAGTAGTDDEVRLATAILHRHTHRGAFDVRPVPPLLVELLGQAASDEGARLAEVTDEDQLIALEVLLSRADGSEEGDDAYRNELQHWVHVGVLTAQGVPASALELVPGSSLTQRAFGVSRPSAPDTPFPERPAVVVLVTDDDAPESWLRAGQALALVLLRAADHGVQAQPLGQVTDVLAYRLRLREALGIVGLPQLVLRMGYAAGVARTPRLGVQDVLTTVTG